MLKIIKAHAAKNLCYITAQKMTPKGIVVHSTGVNNPYLKRYVDAPDVVGKNEYGNHWNQEKPGGRCVCVHAFIGYDKDHEVRVVETLPLDICCWGVGKGKNGSYNYAPAYIQFEICEDGLTDKSYYKKAFSVAAEYCAALCQSYGICVSKIVGHCEAYKQGYGSNHSDPEHWMKRFGESMDDFRNQVSAILKNKEAEKENIKETVSDKSAIHNGDLVSIAKQATYYNGKTIPTWVKTQNWYVKNEPIGDRVVIDKNEKGTSSICSPLHRKFLTVVKPNKCSSASTSASSAPRKCPYLVKITTNVLNIRKGPGTGFAKTGSITDRGTYTIVEEKTENEARKWGKLKSGAGWIALEYTKKL